MLKHNLRHLGNHMTGVSRIINAEGLRNAIRRRVFELVTKRWNRIHGSRLGSVLHGSRKVKAILVSEVDGGDATDMHCGGKVIGGWCHNHEGLRRVDADALNPHPVHGSIWWGSIWEKQNWRFYITPDSRSVVLEEEDGPGSIWAARYSVVVQNGRTSLNLESARIRHDGLPKTWWNRSAMISRWVAILLFVGVIVLGIAIASVILEQWWS